MSGISHTCRAVERQWNKDMGPDSKVFCFFLPAWGLDVCIAPNVKDTVAAQDWAVCPSPQSFFWGGTWLVAANGTDNASQVRDIMLTMTADRDLLRTLAMNYGEMSNDQPLMEELAQSPELWHRAAGRTELHRRAVRCGGHSGPVQHLLL